MKIYPFLVLYSRLDSRGFAESAVASYHTSRKAAIRAAQRSKPGHVAAAYQRDPFQIKSDDLPLYAHVFKDDFRNHYPHISS